MYKSIFKEKSDYFLMIFSNLIFIYLFHVKKKHQKLFFKFFFPLWVS